MADGQKCSACGNPLAAHNDGIELWGSWFCSPCFISQATTLHREITSEDLELLRRFGRELAGFLPPDILEMIIVGFHKRTSTSAEPPSRLEVARCVGEIQRLTAFSCFKQILTLLKTWQDMFGQFVTDQENEIRERMRKLSELDGPV